MIPRDKVLVWTYFSAAVLALATIPLAFLRADAIATAAVAKFGKNVDSGVMLQNWATYFLPSAAIFFALAGAAILRNWSFRPQAHRMALVWFFAPLPLFLFAWFST